MTQASGKVLMATGGSYNPATDKILCDAFNEAAKEWCDRNKKRGKKKKGKKMKSNRQMHGDFNEALYKKLKSQPGGKSFASNIVGRERSFFSGKSGFMGWADQIKNGGAIAHSTPARAKAIRAAVGAASNPSGVSGAVRTGASSPAAGAGWDMTRQWEKNSSKALRRNCWLRRIDGQMAPPDNRIIEVKGPTDGFKGSQARDLQAAGGGKPIVLSCKSCKSPSCSQVPGKARNKCN